jgi:hypothetical protein
VTGFRYFSEVELQELFSLDVSRLSYSHTAQELHKHHATDRAYDPDIAAHVANLTELQFAVDTSDHSVLFSRVDESASGVRPHSSCIHSLIVVSANCGCFGDSVGYEAA